MARIENNFCVRPVYGASIFLKDLKPQRGKLGPPSSYYYAYDD